VEVAGELSNLINRDLKHIYPDRARNMRWATAGWCKQQVTGLWFDLLMRVLAVLADEVMS
jgi:hypothetical protein